MEDYKKDGLLYCGKCNTPKEYKVYSEFLFGGEHIVTVMCRCEQEAFESRENFLNRRAQELKISQSKAAGITSENFKDFTFENDDKAHLSYTQIMKRYADNFNKIDMGLLLYGSYGRGKTFYAAAIANQLLDEGYSVCMTNMTQLVNKINESFESKNEELQKIAKYDLLVIDDLGIERESDFMLEQIYNIIDVRYKSKKPMIITTNKTSDGMRQCTNADDARIYDRILERCMPFEIKGENRRVLASNANYDGLIETLGLNKTETVEQLNMLA